MPDKAMVSSGGLLKFMELLKDICLPIPNAFKYFCDYSI